MNMNTIYIHIYIYTHNYIRTTWYWRRLVWKFSLSVVGCFCAGQLRRRRGSVHCMPCMDLWSFMSLEQKKAERQKGRKCNEMWWNVWCFHRKMCDDCDASSAKKGWSCVKPKVNSLQPGSNFEDTSGIKPWKDGLRFQHASGWKL